MGHNICNDKQTRAENFLYFDTSKPDRQHETINYLINLSLCSDKGIVYSAYAYKIPECSRAAAGTPLIQVC